MRKKRAYVCGPMRGRQYYNFPEFIRTAVILRGLGYRVISPTDLDKWIHHFDGMRCHPDDPCTGAPTFVSCWTGRVKKFNMTLCVLVDILAVLWSDFLLVLDGWEESTGGKAEIAVAKFAGKKLVFAKDLGVGDDAWALGIKQVLEK